MYFLKDLIHNLYFRKLLYPSLLHQGATSEQAKPHWKGNLTLWVISIFKHHIFCHWAVHAIGTEVAHLHLTSAFSAPSYPFSQIKHCSSEQLLFCKGCMSSEFIECAFYQHARSYRLNENTQLNINLNGSKDSRATLSHMIMSTDIPEWRQHH